MRPGFSHNYLIDYTIDHGLPHSHKKVIATGDIMKKLLHPLFLMKSIFTVPTRFLWRVHTLGDFPIQSRYGRSKSYPGQSAQATHPSIRIYGACGMHSLSMCMSEVELWQCIQLREMP